MFQCESMCVVQISGFVEISGLDIMLASKDQFHYRVIELNGTTCADTRDYYIPLLLGNSLWIR